MTKKDNKYSRIELNTNVVGQDNDGLNPFFKTFLGKIICVICCIPLIVILFMLDWKSIYYNNKYICLLQLSLTLLSIFYLLICYVFSRINVYKLENNLKTINYDYYRNILNENSTGVLSFVYNKTLNYKDIIISTVLKLDREKIIKLDYENKKIEILENDYKELTEYERYLLFFMKSECISGIINFSDLKHIVINKNFKVNLLELIKRDSKTKGYYKTMNFSLNIITYILLINYFITIYVFIKNGVSSEAFMVCLANTILLFVLEIVANKKMYLRTKQGKILSNKLIGLKNFLTDFSIINEREVKEITMWDYYIIYAVIFDLKGNLDKDVNILYKEMTE